MHDVLALTLVSADIVHILEYQYHSDTVSKTGPILTPDIDINFPL